MTNTPTYTKTGAKATTAFKLPTDIFAVEIKSHSVIKQAYIAYQANGRTNLAKTLKRGEVSGGGKKPWKQKGTGRARFGSIRVPIWRGGGIVFGPLGKENYARTITPKTKRLAVKQALSLKADKTIVIDSFDSSSNKVSDTVKLFTKIGAKGKVLLVLSQKDSQALRVTNNVTDLKVAQATYLNVFDIINSDTIIFEKKSLELLENWLVNSGQPSKESIK